MIKNYSKEHLHKIRRKDRAKDDSWIRLFLRRAPMGTMATTREGQPFLVTRNFAFDEAAHAIYMHGGMKGRTYDNVQADDRVCFSVSEMGRLLPADKAIEFGVEYAGVVVFGRVSLVTDSEEATHGLQLLLDKYFPHLNPGVDYQPISSEALKITAVFRIDIESWSGKEKKVAEDFPGAFLYGEHP
ncbi:MAG: pyridoxamine 5'-phosphate oxidase family protein [Chloroflexi bacterium]|nr:pyridoxamine 5'-phosphate oxidase family protein [Chloroflexota bacterium]